MPLRLALSLTMALLTALSTGTVGTERTRADAGLPLVVAAHGKCPKPYKDSAPLPCWNEFLGNARTGSFFLRPGEWGVTYAYNCTGDARRFRFSIAIQGHYVGNTGFMRTGRRGSGVVMETGADDWYIQHANDDDHLPFMEYGVIDSACRWSVRIVDGSEAVLQTYVPAVPRRG